MAFDELIQVAGVIDQAEAEMLVRSGVRYLGFPLRLPVHQEDLGEEAASSIIRSLKPPAQGVLITYLERAIDVVELCDSLGASIVQLHGDIEPSELREIKERQPNLSIIKSLVVGLHPVEELLGVIERTASQVDAVHHGHVRSPHRCYRRHGKVHDWAVSAQLVRQSPRPVILAGGLHPQNVRAAILEVRPAGVDSHTGLEDASGRKNEAKVARFIAEAREGFRLASST